MNKGREAMRWSLILAVTISLAISIMAGRIDPNWGIVVDNFIFLFGVMLFIVFEAFNNAFFKKRHKAQFRKKDNLS